MKIVFWIVRAALGTLFAAAGLSKLDAPLRTLADIYAYRLPIPDLLAQGIAMCLPWVEILLGILLLIGFLPRMSLVCAAAMLGMFTTLTASAWWRGLSIDCGCLDLATLHPVLGILSSPGGATLRNLVLSGLVVLLIFWERKIRTRPGSEKPT